jgi:hypothetical protein
LISLIILGGEYKSWGSSLSRPNIILILFFLFIQTRNVPHTELKICFKSRSSGLWHRVIMWSSSPCKSEVSHENPFQVWMEFLQFLFPSSMIKQGDNGVMSLPVPVQSAEHRMLGIKLRLNCA